MALLPMTTAPEWSFIWNREKEKVRLQQTVFSGIQVNNRVGSTDGLHFLWSLFSPLACFPLFHLPFSLSFYPTQIIIMKYSDYYYLSSRSSTYGSRLYCAVSYKQNQCSFTSIVHFFPPLFLFSPLFVSFTLSFSFQFCPFSQEGFRADGEQLFPAASPTWTRIKSPPQHTPFLHARTCLSVYPNVPVLYKSLLCGSPQLVTQLIGVNQLLAYCSNENSKKHLAFTEIFHQKISKVAYTHAWGGGRFN